jgi:aspartate carbamoyltransferase regulatory subunit
MGETVEGFELNEEVWGIVQCYNTECRYRGRMEGIIQWNNKKDIVFICPKCATVERVKNPEHV